MAKCGLTFREEHGLNGTKGDQSGGEEMYRRRDFVIRALRRK